MKNIVKRTLENGEVVDDIPEPMRKYLALQAVESGTTFVNHDMSNGGVNAYGSGLMFTTESPASKVCK